MNALSTRPLSPLFALIATLAVFGCSDPTSEPSQPTAPAGSGSEPVANPEQPGATPQAPPEAKPAETGPAETKPAGEAKPPNAAMQDLQNKILPADAIAKRDAATEALKAKAGELAAALVAGVEKGDVEAIRALLITQTAFDASVAPTYRTIMGGKILTDNDQVAARLVESLGKQKIAKWQWKPGTLSSTSGGVFTGEIPHITQSTIEVEVGDVFVEIDVDQLLYVEDRWQIFRLSLP